MIGSIVRGMSFPWLENDDSKFTQTVLLVRAAMLSKLSGVPSVGEDSAPLQTTPRLTEIGEATLRRQKL